MAAASAARGYLIVPDWEDFVYAGRDLMIYLRDEATSTSFAADLDAVITIVASCEYGTAELLPFAGGSLALRSCEMHFGHLITREMARLLLQRAIYAFRAHRLPTNEEWIVLTEPEDVE